MITDAIMNNNEEQTTVLVVDDGAENVSFVLKVLKKLRPKYKLLGTTSPEKALSLAQHNHWDVIITDYYMPSMNGVELLCRIDENNKENVDVRILLSSIIISELNKEKLMNEGLISAFVDKPFCPVELTDAITKQLLLLTTP